MTNVLSIIIIMVCFYDALLMLLLPSTVNVFCPPDGSVARFVSDMACLSIFGLALYRNGIKPFKNYALLLMLPIIIVSHFHSPNIKFDGPFTPKDMGLYNYKPMLEAFLFMGMLLGLNSLKVDFDKILKCLGICAIAYSVYIILQRMHLDQFYIPAGQVLSQESRNPEVGGFICQPVFAAAFVAILLPFVILMRKPHYLILCLIAILLTGNRSALMIAGIECLLMLGHSIWGAILTIAYPIGLFLANIAHLFNHKIFAEERFTVWPQVIHDIFHSQFPGLNQSHILTGYGLGSFSVLFPFYNHSGFYQAHNEALEVLFTLGIIGLFFFILAAFDIYRKAILSKPIFVSLIGAGLLSCTNPIWHVSQLAFITVLLIGLAYNKSMGDDYGLEKR